MSVIWKGCSFVRSGLFPRSDLSIGSEDPPGSFSHFEFKHSDEWSTSLKMGNKHKVVVFLSVLFIFVLFCVFLT